MIKVTYIAVCGLLLWSGLPAFGQKGDAPASFEQTSQYIHQQLAECLNELADLREQIAAEKIPLSRQLSEMEAELIQVRLDYQQTSRLLDSRALDLGNLRSEIKSRQEESAYLSNLLNEYIRNFESRLHISELQRYRQALDKAKLATENNTLSQQEVYTAQLELLAVSLQRLQEALGGVRFEGTAVDASGKVKTGTFILIGPSAIFRSADGRDVGIVEQRLGSLEPSLIAFGSSTDALAAETLASSTTGFFPLDPTLGNAHRIEATRDTLLTHIRKGGPVMVPIFVLAGTALLVALSKWLALSCVCIPSARQTAAFFKAIARRDSKAILQEIETMTEYKGLSLRDWMIGGMFGAGLSVLIFLVLSRVDLHLPSEFLARLDSTRSVWIFAGIGAVFGGGVRYLLHRWLSYSPVGIMLAAGAEHLDQPRDLIEEVMYEKVLVTRLQLHRFLPFISISAASAPLLGLLGTVTGIINTFKLITVFGSGDVKTLSGGISEALITTEFGLIVAIPSLLIHAFLSRKANGVISQMEKAAVTFMNQISKSEKPPQEPVQKPLPAPAPIRIHTTESGKSSGPRIPIHEYSQGVAASRMRTQIMPIAKTATVGEILGKIRSTEIGEEADAVFIVDEHGKYAGHVPIHRLLTRPDQTRVDSLVENHPLFVRVDTDMREVHALFAKHQILHLPVLDHEDRLVGRIPRNGNGDVK